MISYLFGATRSPVATGKLRLFDYVVVASFSKASCLEGDRITRRPHAHTTTYKINPNTYSKTKNLCSCISTYYK